MAMRKQKEKLFPRVGFFCGADGVRGMGNQGRHCSNKLGFKKGGILTDMEWGKEIGIIGRGDSVNKGSESENKNEFSWRGQYIKRNNGKHDQKRRLGPNL